jgi:hypothetical protein
LAVADVVDDHQKNPKTTRLGRCMPRIIKLTRVAKE